MIAPAIGSRLARWTGDESAHADARQHLDDTVTSLARAGITARGETGADDPLQAADDGLREFAGRRDRVRDEAGDEHGLGRAGRRRGGPEPLLGPGHAHRAAGLTFGGAVVGKEVAWPEASSRAATTSGLSCAASARRAFWRALAVELESTAAKVLMVAAAVLFVPGAFITLAIVRRIAGPPR